MDKYIGKRLDGRYLIQSLIGSGGMANVYKAGDLKENRIVAVKILHEELMHNEDLVRRFKNESKAISVLDHPNIVKVYDVSVSDRLQYIVMEYIDGITLKDYMEYRKQPLTYKETLHFITQTLMALRHAHSKGIVHRDIKPQNIMLLQNGNIKVMDFGIARLSRSENQTMTDKAIGSVHYISPEQAKGDVTDPKSDLYSVGVMMYEMLAGRLPFDGETPVGVAIKQISDTATPLRKVNPSVPEGLAAITERAMAKDPRERYQSAGDMLADIEAFKRNPSIRFEYQYLNKTEEEPTRYIGRAMGRTPARPAAPAPHAAYTQHASQPAAAAAARKGKPRSRFGAMMKRTWGLPVLAGMAVAFGVAAVVICMLIFNMTGSFEQKADVDLPNFYGWTKQQVQASDYMKVFSITFDEQYSNDYDEGTVFDQTPKAPKSVKEGAKITLRVSLGTKDVGLPEVTGISKNDALSALKTAGFTNVMLKRVKVETGPFDVVQKVTDKDGNELKTGTVVNSGSVVMVYVTVEERVKKVKVPDCAMLGSVQDAETLLNSVRLVIGGTVQQDSTYPAGTIIGQEPAAGTEVLEGSSVQLVVSAGHTHAFVEASRTPTYVLYTCACGETSTSLLPQTAAPTTAPTTAVTEPTETQPTAPTEGG